MALFDIIRKVKSDGNIVWRYPKRNFNTGSKLIVDESQEALFYSTGKALDLFGPGKYTLETNNIPLLRGILNIPTGGKTPFTCDVYFIDKTVQAFKWGTSSKIEFLEPIYNFPISIGACGEVKFQIEDSRKLIIKLVGIKKNFAAESVDSFFSSQILVKVKTYLANIIKEEKISIFEIDSKLESISKLIQEKLNEDFDEYGINLKKFFITTVVKPEESKDYAKFKELYFKQGVLKADSEATKQIKIIEAQAEAEKIKIESEAIATKRAQEGYTYQEEKSFEIGKEVAKNDAVGQYTNVGVGLGMMSGIGSSMANRVSNQVTGAFVNTEGKACTNCGSIIKPGDKFCKKCGTKCSIEENIYCTECGTILDNDSLFCPNCGKKVN